MLLSSRRNTSLYVLLPPSLTAALPHKKKTLANLHSIGEFALLLLTRVSDPSHVLVWAGSTHYRSINCVAENERNLNIYITFSNIPKRGRKIPSSFPNTWDPGQEYR